MDDSQPFYFWRRWSIINNGTLNFTDMKKHLLLILLALPFCTFSQIGIKAGFNFANITKASAIDNSSRSGFHAGIFLAPATTGVIGSRTELIFSRQGYNYSTSSKTGAVNLDYIVLPQFMAINITKYFQIQLGAQMAYLLNAKVDSGSSNNMPGPAGKIMSLYNRIDYGFGGGVEIHPVSGLLIGARVNIGLGKLYKDPTTATSSDFVPKVDVKNNVFQIFAGWRFGKNQSKGKE
jgi:hypothetical protein